VTEPAAPSTVGAVVGLAGSVVSGLTPQFLALVVVNTVFVLGLLWFLHGESAGRVQAFSVAMAVCSQHIAKDRPP
jgi:hypothetical protein